MNQQTALKAALIAGQARELAEIKNNGAMNRYLSAKDRGQRKTRNRMAKQSRKANRG